MKSNHHIIAIVVLLIAILGTIGQALADPFTLIIYPGAWDTFPLGINNNNVVVGYYVLPEIGIRGSGYHAFMWNNGTYTNIDYPGSVATMATGINSKGEVVGWYYNSNDWYVHGFTFIGGVYTSFDYPGVTDNYPYTSGTTPEGLNDFGTIVGEYWENGGGEGGKFIKNGNTFSEIYPYVGTGEINGINNNGDIVGFTPQGGFLDSGGNVTLYNFPGTAGSTIFYGINNLGQIAGAYAGSSGVSPPSGYNPAEYQGLILDAGVWSTFSYPGAITTLLQEINDNGTVVGQCWTPNSSPLNYQAFFNGYIDMQGFIGNPVLTPYTAPPPYTPPYTPPSGGGTSVPEPTSLVLLGTGIAGIGLAAWRRNKA